MVVGNPYRLSVDCWCECVKELVLACCHNRRFAKLRPGFESGGIAVNVGKYQNGTSYTRVSARHNSDARAPLCVSFSKGF